MAAPAETHSHVGSVCNRLSVAPRAAQGQRPRAWCPWGDDKATSHGGRYPNLIRLVARGSLVKQLASIVGGGGGGRTDFAEAGGKDVARVPDMLAAASGILEKMLKSPP